MVVHDFHSEQWFPRPLAEVFLFFAAAENLEAITPPWLHFHVVTPQPIEMRTGLKIDYRLRVHGFPIRWQSEITDWNPPHSFKDCQLRGPYRLWHHEHQFTERDGGTLAVDHVRYATPLDFLFHRFFVRPDIERIFAFRREKLAALFGVSDPG